MSDLAIILIALVAAFLAFRFVAGLRFGRRRLDSEGMEPTE